LRFKKGTGFFQPQIPEQGKGRGPVHGLETHGKAVRDLLAVLDCVSLNSCSLAVASAANYRTMRGQGITVRKTIDVIIGTYCIENDLLLLHDDRDFNPMETILGLQALTPN
jgi:hypothetical protein